MIDELQHRLCPGKVRSSAGDSLRAMEVKVENSCCISLSQRSLARKKARNCLAHASPGTIEPLASSSRSILCPLFIKNNKSCCKDGSMDVFCSFLTGLSKFLCRREALTALTLFISQSLSLTAAQAAEEPKAPEVGSCVECIG